MRRHLRIAWLIPIAVTACGWIPGPTTSPVPPTPALVPAAEVSTYRGDAARTGVMPGPGPQGQPELAWQYQADGPIRSSPAVVAGTVFVASVDGTVHALALATGERRWIASVGAELGGATPLVVEGLVIVGDRGGAMHAFDQGTGEEHWKTPVDGPVGGAAAWAGGLVVIATESTAYGLDPAAGRIAWQADLPGAVTRSIAATNDFVFCPLSGGLVVALRTRDGTMAWQARVAPDGDGGTPAVAEGLVFASAGLDNPDPSTRAVVALNASDGSQRWRHTSSSGEVLYAPAVVDGRAFVVAEDGSVAALDAATGEERWSSAVAGIDALPAVWGSTVYVATMGGSLEALDTSSGARTWQVAIQGVPYAPVVIGGFVLVGTNVGVLFAFADPS